MTASAFEHLHPDIRHLATADLKTRKACTLTDRWVSYLAADDALDRLFELVEMPPRIRMPSVLLWADSNMGKTYIQRRFLSLYASKGPCYGADKFRVPLPLAAAGGEQWPDNSAAALWMELNDGLYEKRLYLDILGQLNAPRPDITVPRLQDQVLRHLHARNVRLLILDELQRVTELRVREQKNVLNVLKYLSNQLSMSIAGFGSGEAKALIKSDPHLEQRFDIVALPKWTKRERWVVDAVRERIALMPLRKPTNVDRELMEALFLHSKSVVGPMFGLLERTAVAALEREECLSPALIEAVALRRRRAENG